jgi:hypothetical protein
VNRQYARRVAAAALGVLAAVALAPVASAAGDSTGTSCSDLMVPRHAVGGHVVGETACEIAGRSTVPDSQGRPFARVEIALSGTAAGYVDPVTVGNTRKDVTDVPNILFPQFGIPSWKPAVATYSGNGATGPGLTVLYPTSGTPWNGKIIMLSHGQSNNAPMGDLVPRRAGDGLDPNTFDNLYAGLAIDAGYAVIYTRRPAESGVPAKLDSGQTLDESLNDNVNLILDWAQTGEKLLAAQLGRAPSHVYFYGHSSGVILGRLLNYSGLNDKPGGGHYFDGFFSDDPGGGLPLPLSLPEGQVLGHQGSTVTFPSGSYLGAASRAGFAPELTLAHNRYTDIHSWLPGVSYLDLKLQGQSLYLKQGLGAKTRLYEVDGVSHIAATAASPPKTLDIGGLFDGTLTALDQWVTSGVTPPATMADLPGTGHGHAVELPPMACPTGIRYAWPAPDGAASETGYAPYDGRTPEPVDSRGALVDVDGNGHRDAMPTIDQAWQRMGLLAPHHSVTAAAYAKCVQSAAGTLEHKRLLPKSVADWYVKVARQYPGVPW